MRDHTARALEYILVKVCICIENVAVAARLNNTGGGEKEVAMHSF